MTDSLHPTHKTRISMDASSYDEICVNCGATDRIGSWGDLAKPCPFPNGRPASGKGDLRELLISAFIAGANTNAKEDNPDLLRLASEFVDEKLK